MAKLELNIEVTYVPQWGLWEGVRELVQNGRDAQVEFDAPLTVTHRGGVLTIRNEGCQLDPEALLFGHTTKYGNSGMIGQFGEGLKLGLLAIARLGREVTIHTGPDRWVPEIVRSTKFNADVLQVDIQKGRCAKSAIGSVEVRVDVTMEEWEEMLPRFLFLHDCGAKYSTDHGDLLLERPGRLYVKGIWVENDQRMGYGYNFKYAETDRDRAMVRGFDKSWHSSRIWGEAAARHGKDILNKLYSMLEENAEDVRGFEHTAGYLEDGLAEQVSELFVEKHGEDAIPVSSMATSMEVGHLGAKGVVVDTPLRVLVEKKLGGSEIRILALREEVVKKYGWHDLTPEEQGVLDEATGLAELSHEGVLERLDIVDFRSPELLGQYSKDTGRISVARKNLGDVVETLSVIVHEIAHHTSQAGDGDVAHVRAIEDTWASIVRKLKH